MTVNGLRRFLLVGFSMCGLVLTAVLALPWYGPFRDEARVFLSNKITYNVVLVLLAIVAIGFIVQLAKAIASRRVNVVNVAVVDGGQIAVTCDAIASTAANIVEQNSSCRVDDVRVKARGKNRVNVRMRLAPYAASDIYDGGSTLHAALMSGLSSLCGDALQSVSLQFVEPQTNDLTPPDAQAINHYGEPQGGWEYESAGNDALYAEAEEAASAQDASLSASESAPLATGAELESHKTSVIDSHHVSHTGSAAEEV